MAVVYVYMQVCLLQNTYTYIYYTTTIHVLFISAYTQILKSTAISVLRYRSPICKHILTHYNAICIHPSYSALLYIRYIHTHTQFQTNIAIHIRIHTQIQCHTHHIPSQTYPHTRAHLLPQYKYTHTLPYTYPKLPTFTKNI